jgi:nickel transport system substrate-binding protein
MATGFFLNVRKAPTDDLAVRQALNYAVDRKTIVDKLFFGVQRAAVGPLSQGVFSRLDELDKLYAFDPAKAMALLEGAGWKTSGSDPIRQKSGQRLEIVLATFREPWSSIAEALLGQFRVIGADLKIQKMAQGPYLDFVRSFKHNMAASRGTSLDPEGILRPCFSTGGIPTTNFSNLSDPKIDAILDKASPTEVGSAARKQLYEDAQRLIMDLIPFVSVISQIRVTAMSVKVHGLAPDPDGLTLLPIADTWVEA